MGDKIEGGILQWRHRSLPSLSLFVSSHLAFPYSLLSFPVSPFFLSLPSPCWDHMTGATCITLFSKNTSAERFMRDERGGTHSSSDVADWKRGVYVHSQALHAAHLRLMCRQMIVCKQLESLQSKSWKSVRCLIVIMYHGCVTLATAIHQKPVTHACRHNTLT